MTTWRTKGHRGDTTENEINYTHELYKKQKLAYIKKNYVPIKVIAIDNKGMITKAFFEEKAYVDYSGMVQGTGISFDVKETELKSLPLHNIHLHQIEDLKEHEAQGGIGFIIVNFKVYDEYYIIPLEVLVYYYEKRLNGGRKSIPYSIMDKRLQIKIESNRVIHYLPVINNYLQLKKELKEKYRL